MRSTPGFLAEFAPAKINLALHVTGRRDDGYHLIETLVVFCAAGDRLWFRHAAADRFEISGPFAADIAGEDTNLVLKARDLLRETERGARSAPVAIHLEKNLPVASGVGGGSADAAATLRGLSRLWRIGGDGWRNRAVELGADVPMCLAGRPLIARGIGDRLETLPGALPDLSLVLVNPGVAADTPGTFAQLANKTNAPLPPLPVEPDADALTVWLAASRNDLEPPAERRFPEVRRALDALEETRALIARMSGSGATCFGVYSDRDEADRAVATIRRNQPGWFVVSTFPLLVPGMRSHAVA